MNSRTLKDIYDNARSADLSEIAAESLAYFAKKNERYLVPTEEEIGTEATGEFVDYFKETLVPSVKELRDMNTEETFESISEQFHECFEKVSSASTEFSTDEDVISITNAYTKPKNGIYIEACEFIASDEDDYNDKVSYITSIIGDTGNFIPVIEATGIDVFSVKYLYPCNKEMDEMVGVEDINEWLDVNSYKDNIHVNENIEDIAIKDVDGEYVTPLAEVTAESILDYVSNATSKSLYNQMKDVYDKYGEESVQFESATKLYSKIAKVGAEATVTSMCVCGALGIPFNTTKLVFSDMFDLD